MDYSGAVFQCLIVLFIMKSALTHALSLSALNDIGNRTQCVSLCSECSCLGYFCGEECICECSSDSEKDITCLAKLKTHCDTLNLPYDVLIQGSAGRRFVREIRDLTPEQEAFYRANERNRRSVYNIHEANPWRSGKEEPMAFEDRFFGAPGIAGDLESLASKIKTEIVLKEIRNKLGSPLNFKPDLLGAPLFERDLFGDIRVDFRDNYEKLRDGVRAIPHRIDEVTMLKLKPLVPRRENILKEKIEKLADVVDGPGDDTVIDTAARVLDFKLRSPGRLANYLMRT